MPKLFKLTFIAISIALFMAFLFPQAPFAQNSSPSISTNQSLERILGGTNHKVKLLVLPFRSIGLTETAAKSYSLNIVQDLTNTNQFEVVGPEETEFLLERENPGLIGCTNTGCGVQIGKIIQADLVLGGVITFDKSSQFILDIKLVNVVNNELEFSDKVRFDDENIDHRFYTLTKKIGEHTPINGSVVSANNKIVVISMGNRQGIKVGDQFVVYKQEITNSSDNNDESQSRRTTHFAIIKAIRVEENFSECTYFQFVGYPQPGYLVTTFLDRQKQIALVTEVRRELDTKERKTYGIESVAIEPVALFDKDMKRWISKLRYYESRRNIYQIVVFASGIVSLYFMKEYKTDDSYKLGASLAIFGYGAYEWLNSRNKLDELIVEGKYKGYLDVRLSPNNSGASLRYTLPF